MQQGDHSQERLLAILEHMPLDKLFGLIDGLILTSNTKLALEALLAHLMAAHEQIEALVDRVSVLERHASGRVIPVRFEVEPKPTAHELWAEWNEKYPPGMLAKFGGDLP